MLAKSNRLTRKEFETYYKTGKRLHTLHLQLIYSPATTFSAAVVVGKKVAKKAVTRNTLRRQIYGVVYRVRKIKNLSGIFIIIAKPSIHTLSRRELLTETHQLLEKLK